MKSIKITVFTIFFSLFSLPIFSQTSLSNTVYSFLKNNNCNPKTQSLVSSQNNLLPYNISVDYPAKNTLSTTLFNNKENFYIIFNQEDVVNNFDVFIPFFNHLKTASYDFNISLNFVYGEKQVLSKTGIIYGSEVFLNYVNTNEESTALIVNFDSDYSQIITASNGITAPSWLIKNEHDVFYQNNESAKLPLYYISQLYSYKFYKNRQLDSFFQTGIPTLLINLNRENKNYEQKAKILIDSLDAYSQTPERIWDQHFLLFNFLGRYLRLSEANTVRIIIFLLLTFLLFIALLGFINTNLQKDAWEKIKKIWYVVPITFSIVVLSCFLGKVSFSLLINLASLSGRLYLMFGLELFFAFLLTTVYFIIQIIFNKQFKPRSIDFVLVITIVINQVIFMFFDISLFPVFMVLGILSVIALRVKNNITHIILLLLMVIPIAIYSHSLTTIYNINELFNYLYHNNFSVIFMSLVLYPLFLLYFRILFAFEEYFNNRKTLFIGGGITLGIAFCAILLIGTIRTNQVNKTLIDKTISYSQMEMNSSIIKIDYSDKQVFDDTIRMLHINFEKPCHECDIRITSPFGNPILYSSDDYAALSNNEAIFLIPNDPPQKLKFSYGTDNGPQTITVTAIYSNSQKDEFSLCSKSITINE